MSESKASRSTAAQLGKSGPTAKTSKLDLSVKVFPAKKEGNLLAFASVTLADCFAVRGIRIMDSEKGAFVAMPDRKDSKDEYHDICFPTTPEMREALNTAVLGEYQRVVELIAAKGEKARTSVRDTLQSTAKKAAERPAPDRARPPQQRKADKVAR